LITIDDLLSVRFLHDQSGSKPFANVRRHLGQLVIEIAIQDHFPNRLQRLLSFVEPRL
jgi:hypothetical protein